MKEKGIPTVSAILILDHTEKQLWKQSLDSILIQEGMNRGKEKQLFDLEQIIMINRTQDNRFPEWLQEEYEKEERIILLEAEEGMTLGEAVNGAVSLATGTYLAFLFSGNYWIKEKTAAQILALEAREDTAWIYSMVQKAGGKKTCIPPADLPAFQKAGFLFPDLIRKPTINLTSLMIRRKYYDEIGGMDPELPAYAEEEFILRFSLQYPIAYQEQVTAVIQEPKAEKEPRLAVRLLLLEEFREQLEETGLAKEVLEEIYKEAEEANLEPLFWQYADYLKEDILYQKTLEELWGKKHPTRELLLSQEPTVAGVVNCVGCCGCESSCPVDAITMVYNKEGFFYPRVDEKTCILCGKCLRVCPTQQQLSPSPLPKRCYALQAGEEKQQESSSGGIFPLLAQCTIEEGGYVAGAVYGEDFHVRHILGNTMEDISLMRSSKYVQSDTRGIFEKIRKKLTEGKEVLFTGTACQVAGLKGYLQKEYENLYTIDVVCHGVPSPLVYQSYLEEHKRQAGPIAEINFRKKEALGWKSGVYIRFKSGQCYLAKGYDPYMAVFLNDWGLRKCCSECEFKAARYSDMTLGDFWGIERLDPKLETGSGTSVVLVNTPKGVQLLGRIRKELHKLKVFETSQALLYNPSIGRSVKEKKFRELFFAQFYEKQKDTKKKPLQQVIVDALHSIRFDIGLVLWWSPNYGNAITNYALYKLLEKKYRVMAIDNLCMSPMERFARFAREHYELSSDYFPRGAAELIGNSCKTYIVGSDQTWNYYFEKQFGLGKYFQLDFIPKHKNKISYAASFGMAGAEPPAEEYAKDYQRFNAISVREQFGVESCKKYYGMEAAWVLDPVFLLTEEDYAVLAEKSRVREEEPFILAYLLNPSVEKVQVCKKLQKLMGDIKLIHVSENSSRDRERNRHLFAFKNVMGDIEVEDWIYYMKNASFIITDSFHGTCFSAIFHKRFIAFVNRQKDRFLVFEQFSFLPERIISEIRLEEVEKYLEDIAYDVVEKELDRERERSRRWLEAHICI